MGSALLELNPREPFNGQITGQTRGLRCLSYGDGANSGSRHNVLVCHLIDLVRGSPPFSRDPLSPFASRVRADRDIGRVQYLVDLQLDLTCKPSFLPSMGIDHVCIEQRGPTSRLIPLMSRFHVTMWEGGTGSRTAARRHSWTLPAVTSEALELILMIKIDS